MEPKEITLSVGRCPVCRKPHDEIKAVKLAELGENKATHSGECPDNPGKSFPVWHSGS